MQRHIVFVAHSKKILEENKNIFIQFSVKKKTKLKQNTSQQKQKLDCLFFKINKFSMHKIKK